MSQLKKLHNLKNAMNKKDLFIIIVSHFATTSNGQAGRVKNLSENPNPSEILKKKK